MNRTLVRDVSRRRFLAGLGLAASGVPAILKSAERLNREARPTKIGIEEHWSTKEVDEQGMLWRANTKSQVGGDPQSMAPGLAAAVAKLADFETRLATMDAHGIRMQVVSLSSPGLQGYTETAKAIAVARRANDSLAEGIQRHPTRFAAFAALPTQNPKAAADELERTIKQLSFRGAMIHGHTNWDYLDGQKHRVLWERAASLRVPIYLHVNDPSSESRKMYAEHPELAGSAWGWGVETASHALRIICAGIFDAYPAATLILGHLGESLPYLLGRLDEGYNSAPPRARKLKKPLSAYIRENILVTTSGLYRPEALVCAISAMGPDRVLFAGDYPFVDQETAVEIFERTPMSDETRQMISHRNAERWLGLPA